MYILNMITGVHMHAGKLILSNVHCTCYSCTMAARGLRGMREWQRYIDHEGGARVGL